MTSGGQSPSRHRGPSSDLSSRGVISKGGPFITWPVAPACVLAGAAEPPDACRPELEAPGRVSNGMWTVGRRHSAARLLNCLMMGSRRWQCQMSCGSKSMVSGGRHIWDSSGREVGTQTMPVFSAVVGVISEIVAIKRLAVINAEE